MVLKMDAEEGHENPPLSFNFIFMKQRWGRTLYKMLRELMRKAGQEFNTD